MQMQYSQPIPLGWGEKQSSPMKIEIYGGEKKNPGRRTLRTFENAESNPPTPELVNCLCLK